MKTTTEELMQDKGLQYGRLQEMETLEMYYLQPRTPSILVTSFIIIFPLHSLFVLLTT